MTTNISQAVITALVESERPRVVRSLITAQTILVTDGQGLTVGPFLPQATHLVLIQTEAPPTPSYVSKVDQFVLVEDPSRSNVNHTAHNLLVSEQAPIVEMTTNGVGSIAIIQQRAPLLGNEVFNVGTQHHVLVQTEQAATFPQAAQVNSGVVIQIEHPSTSYRAGGVQLYQAVLIQDQQPISGEVVSVTNTVLVNTEVPTKNPERIKTAANLIVGNQLFVDPTTIATDYSTAQAAHLIASPNESFEFPQSDSTIASVVAQSVIEAAFESDSIQSDSYIAQTVQSFVERVQDQKHPAEIQSDSYLSQVTSSVVTELESVNPSDISSDSVLAQIVTSSAAPRVFGNPSDITSENKLSGASKLIVTDRVYPERVQSASKLVTISEQVSRRTVFRDPETVQSLSQQASLANLAAASLTTLRDPSLIRPTSLLTNASMLTAESIIMGWPTSPAYVSNMAQETAAERDMVDPTTIDAQSMSFGIAEMMVIKLDVQTPPEDVEPETRKGVNIMGGLKSK